MRYNLGNKFEGIYFTQREAECMTFLLQRKSIATIAKTLYISPKTVNCYIKNMRRKLKLKTIPDLLNVIFETDFLIVAKDLPKKLSTIQVTNQIYHNYFAELSKNDEAVIPFKESISRDING